MHDFDANNEEFKSLIKNIELKLENKDSFYLDVEEIGNVANYYLEKGVINKALVILKIGLNLTCFWRCKITSSSSLFGTRRI